MKTRNLFLTAIVTFFGVIVESSGQTVRLVTATPTTSNTIGNGNSVNVGTGAGNGTTTGGQNVFVGALSGSNNTTGFDNAFYGYYAGNANQTGNYNTFLGRSSGYVNTTGSSNCFVGYGAGRNGNGDNNTYVGYRAGFLNSGSASGNVFIGASAGYSLTNAINTLIIQNDFSLTPLIFGDFSAKYVDFNGNIGINLPTNSAPNNSLEIRKGTNVNSGSSGLRFTNLTSAFVPTSNALKFLTVDSSGDVILRNLPPSSGTDSQTLSIVGNQLTISNGNTVELPGSLSCNLYTCDGTLSTLPTNSDNPNPGLRTVTMGNNNLFFDTSSSVFANGTAGSGRVYIGNNISFPNLNNTAPNISQYRLLVEGGILTERVKVATNGTVNWADYVFADDYKLMPLNEVETFITKNNHLPGIESAETLSNEGLDLGDMQAKQMAKIEELTLYVIQQNKEIEELKAQMKLLLEKTK